MRIKLKIREPQDQGKGVLLQTMKKKYTVALEDLLQTYPMITHEDTIRREGAQKNF